MAEAEAGPSARPEPAGLQRPLALLVAGAFFMEILDGTVIAPAAPHIAADLGVAAVDVNVAITGYLLTLAVLIPISGWLADRFGARRVFTAALVIFTVASAGCALAPTLPVLTATRVLQGVGGAMMVPVGRLAVLRTTPKRDLVRAIAFLTWPALVAPVIAPALGGLLANYASGRWLVATTVPPGAAGPAPALGVAPAGRGPRRSPPARRGFRLTAGGAAALVVGLESIGAARWGSAVTGLVLAAVLLTVAVLHLLRARRPLLDLRVLRVATYRLTAAGGSVYRMVITAIPFLLPLLFQLGFGWSAAQAGLVVIALFVGNVGIKPATTPLMRRFGIRTLVLFSVAASAACLVGMAFLTEGTPPAVVLLLLLASGIVRSTGFTAYNSVAYADVESDRMTGANTLMSTLQELGAGLGVAVGALFVRLGDPIGQLTGMADAPATPYRVAFLLLVLVLLVPAVEALRLSRTAGDAVTGRASAH